MREVPYFDSAGLELFAEWAKRFMSAGQRLKLAEVNELCHETLDVTRLIRHFELFETTDDAIRSFL